MKAQATVFFDNVSKHYTSHLFGWKRVVALQNITFSIPSCTVTGLIGPNRSGKTTLLKLLLSLCRPTSGFIERLGSPVSDTRTLARVGYMHENYAFPKYLSAREVLYLYGRLTGLSGSYLRRRVETELIRVGLIDRQNEPIRSYSKGMIQRLGLAQAILADPELLVLDEPTEGLDLFGRQLLRQIIVEFRTAGKTVLLVSHTLSEIEQLCDRILVLVNGKVVYDGTINDLLKIHHHNNEPLEKVLMTMYQMGSAV